MLCSQIWPPQGRRGTRGAPWEGPPLPEQKPGPTQPSRPSTQSPREQSHRQASVLPVSSLRLFHGASGRSPSRAASPPPATNRWLGAGAASAGQGRPHFPEGSGQGRLGGLPDSSEKGRRGVGCTSPG